MNHAVAVTRTGGALALFGGLVAAAAWLSRETAVTVTRLWDSRDLLTFDDLVLLCALAVLTAAATWLTVAVTLTATTEVLRCTQGSLGRLARLITPRLCRALVRGVCGAAALSMPCTLSAGAVTVEPSRASPPGCTVEGCADNGSRLPIPDRVSSREAAGSITRVGVRRGGTLWAIASRHLPAGATDAEIAAAWPRWFKTNRSRIGSDPDLIHPRTRLVVPPRFRPDDKDP